MPYATSSATTWGTLLEVGTALNTNIYSSSSSVLSTDPAWVNDSTAYATGYSYRFAVDEPVTFQNGERVYFEPGAHGPIISWGEAEQARQRVEAERERVRQQAENLLRLQQERQEANDRALALLNAHLTPSQRDTLEKMQHILVTSQSGKQYRLRLGWTGNVDLMEHGQPRMNYCIHATTAVPYADLLLAQKLMLETNEAEFLRIANGHPV